MPDISAATCRFLLPYTYRVQKEFTEQTNNYESLLVIHQFIHSDVKVWQRTSRNICSNWLRFLLPYTHRENTELTTNHLIVIYVVLLKFGKGPSRNICSNRQWRPEPDSQAFEQTTSNHRHNHHHHQYSQKSICFPPSTRATPALKVGEKFV